LVVGEGWGKTGVVVCMQQQQQQEEEEEEEETPAHKRCNCCRPVCYIIARKETGNKIKSERRPISVYVENRQNEGQQ